MSLRADIDLPTLRKLRAAVANTKAANNAIARACSTLVRKHFSEISPTEKNRFGAASKFWKRMIQSVDYGSDASMAYVEMNRAIAQRYFGGTIKPTGGKKFLTIPLSKLSYGKSARSFDGLQFVKSGSGGLFLAMPKKVRGKTKMEFLYLLKSKVTQKGNRRILPTREQFVSTMAESYAAYLNEKTE